MVFKLYATARAAGGGAGVAMVLAEKQVPFELVVVDMAAKAHKTPEHLAMHPFGQVPVADDDGFILYESRAICRYVAEKYADRGPALIPTELKARALFEQAASVEYCNFFPVVGKVYLETIAKKREGLDVDQAALDKHIAELSAKLDVYEVILGKQKYLAGNEFTLVDLIHLMSGPLLLEAGCDLLTSKGPNITRWWNDITSRPSWIKLKEEGIKSTN
ncbi:glutathione S-transferase [Mycena sp. CBHHK59/15]|nr:glutathione S-transferase [Mycena sp. CBHHK59/15]